MSGPGLRHPGPFGFDDTDRTLADPAKAGVFDSTRSRSCRLRVTKIPTVHDESELEPTRRTMERRLQSATQVTTQLRRHRRCTVAGIVPLEVDE